MRDVQVGLYICGLNDDPKRYSRDMVVYEQFAGQHGQYSWEVLAQYFSPLLPPPHVAKGRPMFCITKTRIVGPGKLLWVDPRNATYVGE